ncbi:MAG: NAD(P)-dependent alcohol dehydrogenase [Chloroflexota bacterium]
MQAIMYYKYGSPDVLKLQDVEKPAPMENEVLVKVHAAAVNPIDWHTMRAEPFLVRLGNGFFGPKKKTLGADIAGRVEAVGKGATEFQPGDEVFGDIYAGRMGGFAEYTCAAESALTAKPDNLSFQEAAAVPVVAYTALQGLRDKGEIQSGQRVLINGASGGVGTFALQLAKYFGAEVTGVCSTRNLEMVRAIGADHVIDYTQEDFTKSGRRYDLIYDAVGNRSVSEYANALNPQGRCVVVGMTTLWRLFHVLTVGAWVSRRSDKTIGFMGFAQANKDDLNYIRGLLESGEIRPTIDRSYRLAECAEAIRYLETGRARGKVVISIDADAHTS